MLPKYMVRTFMFMLVSLPLVSKGQAGNGITDAIQAGCFNKCSGSTYTDSRNNYYFNGTYYSSNYNDEGTQYYGQPSPDVWYKIEIGEDNPSLLISLQGSSFIPYVHLVDSDGNEIASMASSYAGLAAISYDGNYDTLLPGTYYIVVEGYGYQTSNYNLSISTSSCQ